ncbi:uncharacterized protein LOC132730400 [Ruditapes philippinarum]|uniref:uncharacterized protein LOC132730400 n=1 Tax=Ruditapes philippinarum TaxID=129788 RepID=UPI00295A7DE8|nr:uncharacterized protein LOC132730400 [Ruditapes philippinarum]
MDDIYPPQNISSPFIIDVNTTVIRPGETIRVKVRSNKGEMFRGLFLQVHPIPNSANDEVKYEAAGLFDRKLKNVKIMTCRILLDTLTHKDPFMKIEASFDWRAPLYLTRNLVVRATILKNFDTYWHNVMSPKITVIKDEISEVKSLEKPWLKEIIKTIKSEYDVSARRDIVRARFERGFRQAIDRNGIVMVNFVTNLLPFEDSHVPRALNSNQSVYLKGEPIQAVSLSDTSNVTLSTNDTNDISQSAENENTTDINSIEKVPVEEAGENITAAEVATNVESSLDWDTDNGEEFNDEDIDFDHNVAGLFNETFDMSHEKNTPMMEQYYEVLVKSLLKGDEMVADTLSELLENN